MPAGQRPDRAPRRTAREPVRAGGADVLTVQPDPARLELLEPFAGVLGEVNHMRDLVVTALARRVADEVREPDDVTPFAVEGLILELLALMARLRNAPAARVGRRPPRWLAEARDLLHDRYAERLLVTDVADAVGVHPVHPLVFSGSTTARRSVPTCGACA